jgi:hypothetical protein
METIGKIMNIDLIKLFSINTKFIVCHSKNDILTNLIDFNRNYNNLEIKIPKNITDENLEKINNEIEKIKKFVNTISKILEDKKYEKNFDELFI